MLKKRYPPLNQHEKNDHFLFRTFGLGLESQVFNQSSDYCKLNEYILDTPFEASVLIPFHCFMVRINNFNF